MKKILIIVCIATVFSLAPFASFAALDFTTGANNKVDYGSDPELDDLIAFTFWTWIKFDSFGANRGVMSKPANNGVLTENHMLFQSNAAGRGRFFSGRAGTDAECGTADSFFAVGVWYFYAGTYDEAATPACKIYKGVLGSTVFESSSYITQVSGSGATATTSNTNFQIGPRTVAGTDPFDGQMAVFGVVNRVLSLGELRSLQYFPRPVSGTVLLSWLGFTGTGTHADYSGYKNNGTTTGSGVIMSRNAPLGPSFGR